MTKIKLTKQIYVASPYTGRSKYSVVNWFIRHYRNYKITKIIGKLQEYYPYAFIGPITQSHQTAKHMKIDTGFDSWATRDFTYVANSKEVWVALMNGWQESYGVTEEIKFAKARGIRVRYIHPETLKFVRIK